MTVPGRTAGVLIPLFSFPSSSSWGIGDMSDVAPMSAWLSASGQHVLQLLPMNEMAADQQSPYSALSGMAIDPIYISVPAALDAMGLKDQVALPEEMRPELERVRHAARVEYRTVRRLKQTVLANAFEALKVANARANRDWPERFHAFLSAEDWWLRDYALFRAIHDRQGQRPWTEWPEPLARREPRALERARDELFPQVLFYCFLQWLADSQWRAARAAAAARGVAIFGDLPFMVDTDSADVWARQDQFRLDISVGAPPDAFSAEGQDWGTPMYQWDAMAADGFQWLRDRARRNAALYDGCRVDHLVGFYRTYGRPRKGGAPFFSPALESDQVRLGESILRIFSESGAQIIAEDLGTVPDYVRASLARLGIPGYRVLRWERHWHTAGQPFRDPAEYPSRSVATSGTHDTEPLATWWDSVSSDERRRVSEVPTVRQLTDGKALDGAPYEPVVRDVLLESLFASGSNLVLPVVQDLFGWRDRINDPATASDRNWTFRLPWPCDRLDEVPAARERQAMLRSWTERHNRYRVNSSASEPAS